MKARKKLQEILLIDDDESTNFINKIVLSKIECAEEISAVQSAKKALELLIEKSKQEPYSPNLIFLDINMPGMDGWQFLEKYRDLPTEYKRYVKVIMLSTSMNPDDKYRALQIEDVIDYQSKPLTIELAKDIIKYHFGKRTGLIL